MVDVSLIQPVSQVAAAIGVCVAAIYYVMVLREQRRNTKLTLETRQAQVFRDFHKTMESYEFTKMFQEIFYDWNWVDFNDFMAKYGKNDIDARTKMTIVFGYFEGIGIMTRRGLISVDLVYEFYYNTIIAFWEKYAVIVGGLRVMFGSPQFYEPVEWLYGEMKRLQVARGHGFDRSALK